MRCLCWSLVSTAVVMTLSAGCANRSAASANTPGSGSPAAPATAITETAQASPSQQAAAKMTEQDYDAIMKEVGTVYASMRKILDSGEINDAAKQPQRLAELFGEAEKFWAQHNRQDAVRWSQRARSYATQIATDVTAAEGFRKLDPRVQSGIQVRVRRARTMATNLGDMCKRCHDPYREADGATGYRIKPGALAR